MLKKKNSITICEFCFFVFYGILIVWRLLVDSEFGIYIFTSEINKLIGFFLILGFLFTYFSKKISSLTKFLKVVGLMCFATIIVYNAKSYMLFLIILALVASRNIQFIKIVKFSAVVCLGCTLFIVLCSLSGIIPNRIFNSMGSTGDQFGLGFTYFTLLPSIVLYLILMRMYMKKNVSYIELIVYVFVFLWLYQIAEVNLNLYLGIALVFLYLIFEKWNWFSIEKKWFRFVVLLSVVFLIITIIFISLNYTPANPVMNRINQILNYRLYFCELAYQNYGVNLFGNNLSYVTNATANDTYFYIDIGYVYYLINYGLVGFLAFVVCLIYVLNTSMKANDKIVFIWCIIVIIESMVGRTLDSIWRNPLLFIVIYYSSNNLLKKWKSRVRIRI